MTIAVCIKANDGIVLASDSASTLMSQDEKGNFIVVNVFLNADKIFNLCKGFPIGAMTWGTGSIGKASLSTIAKDFRRKISDEMQKKAISVKNISEKFAIFLKKRYEAAYKEAENPPQITFLVVGYDDNSTKNSSQYIITISKGKKIVEEINKEVDGSVNWFGQPEAIFRLIKGRSPHLEQVLQKLGLSDSDAKLVIEENDRHVETPLIHDAMPIQDAIDLAEFLVHLTIMYHRFNPGQSVVDGPIEIAAITKHEGFKWVKRKHYYEPEYNPVILHEKN